MQDIVGETSFGEGHAHIIDIPHSLLVAHRYSGLDRPGLAIHAKSKPFIGVSLHLSGRLILSLDYYRRAARGGNQHVGMAAWIVRESLGVLRANLTARHHASQQVAKGVVSVRFCLSRHC